MCYRCGVVRQGVVSPLAWPGSVLGLCGYVSLESGFYGFRPSLPGVSAIQIHPDDTERLVQAPVSLCRVWVVCFVWWHPTGNHCREQ